MPSSKRSEQYTVEALVVQGEGIPDGDLVTKYVNGKVRERLFIPFADMKVILKSSSGSEGVKGKAEKIVYAKLPQSMEASDKRVIVQSKSKLGNFIKQGGMEEVGAIMVNGVLKGLIMLFAG